MKRIITLILSLIISINIVSAQNFPPSKHEVRAVWLTTIGGIDWPHSYSNGSATAIARQQAELTGILDKLKAANVNTILLQTRVRATTIYPSRYEPWDGCTSGHPGVSPGYDPLEFAIKECHKRGMELHAWVVSIPIGKWNGAGCKALRSSRPDLVKKIGEEGYMNPEAAGTADYIANICDEITRKYDIDGIHLDYIRYPETWKNHGNKDIARRNITNIVKKVNAVVKGQKPWVKISCSPIGKATDLSRYSSKGWNAYNTVSQDATGWLKNGLMDMEFPMMYFKANNFYPFAIDWKEQSNGRPVVPGLGIYFLSPKEGNWPLEEIKRQMGFLRSIGMGHAYFRSKFFTDNTKGIYTLAKNEIDRYPALVPPMTWQNNKRPSSPSNFKIDQKGQNIILQWMPGKANNDSPEVMYNIYASCTYPVDTEKPENILYANYRGTSLSISKAKGMKNMRYFAVTTVDRYGNESNREEKERKTYSNSMMLDTYGKMVQLPSQCGVTNATHLIIASKEGVMLKTIPFRKGMKELNVSDMKTGVYQLRSLDSKGHSHRLGWFSIAPEKKDN